MTTFPSRSFRWISTRFAIALGFYAIAYTSLNVSFSRGVEAEKAWWRDQGLPVSAEELMRPPFSPDVRPEDDARLPFEAAAALWKTIPDGEKEPWIGMVDLKEGRLVTHVPGPDTPLTDSQTAELKDWIGEHEIILHLLKDAVERPASSRSIDYMQGPAVLLPNIQYGRGLAQFSMLSAIVRASDGDRAAYDAWEASLGPAQGISGDHGALVTLLVQIAIERLACRTLQPVLEACPADAETLGRIAERVARLCGQRGAYARAMTGERAGMGGVIYDGWLAGRVDSHTGAEGTASGFVRIWLQADYLAYLKLFRRIHENENRPSWEILSGGSVVDRAFAENEVPRYAFLTRLLMPAIDRVNREVVAAEATRLTTRYGVQLARHKLAAGAYPETLEGLTPELRSELPGPVDPCTGRPLVYRREGEGFVVYSLGKNQKDDNGLAAGWGGKEIPADADDIAFRLSK